MDADAQIIVEVRIRTRDDMNTATPRIGNWTYHHVQPVRVYYLTASLMLRLITDENSYDLTRALATDTLCKMCNNPHNRTSVRNFVDRYKNTEVADSDRRPIAALCASPPFGGFAGPNPAQRADDPHDGAETLKPLSAPGAWWDALGRVGAAAFAAFGLHNMPQPNTTHVATKSALDWNDVVLSLIDDLEIASGTAAPPFTGTDWNVTDPAAESWAMLTTGAQRNAWVAARPARATAYPQMALRRATERYTFLDVRTVPADSLARRGAVPLRPRDGQHSDFLDYF